MGLRAGFLPSTNDNINSYTSRDLIKPFEFLFHENSNIPPYGIVPGMLDSFECSLVRDPDAGGTGIAIGPGVAIVENFDDIIGTGKDFNDINLWELEHNILFSNERYFILLNKKYDANAYRSPSISSDTRFDQIYYNNKSFYDLFRENMHSKTNENGTILIMEVRILLIKTDSEGNSLPSNDTSLKRYCFGPSVIGSGISVVSSDSTPDDFLNNCHSGLQVYNVEHQPNSILLGWVVGNLAYCPKNPRNLDPDNLEIFENALYFYDYRKFAHSIIFNDEKFMETIKMKKELLSLYAGLSTLTTDVNYGKQLSPTLVTDSLEPNDWDEKWDTSYFVLSDGKYVLNTDSVWHSGTSYYLMNDKVATKNFLQYIFISNEFTKMLDDFGLSSEEQDDFINLINEVDDVSSISISDLDYLNRSSIQTYYNFTYNNDFIPYGDTNENVVYSNGNIIKIYGSIRYTGNDTDYDIGFNSILLCKLPEGVPKPKNMVRKRNHCSGTGEYLLTINPENGELYMSKLVRNGKYDKLTNNEWIQIEAFYIV